MLPISVLMAVHNGSGHVHAAIDSILRQTFNDFEFIIVDDGSTDDTKEIIKRYQDVDHRIRLISVAHAGQTRALNVGLIQCQGRYIARQDADDVSLPRRLSVQHQWIDSCEENVLVGCRARYFDNSKEVLRLFREPPTNQKVVRRHLTYKNVFLHTSLMFRRIVSSRPVFYDDRIRYSQDFDLVTRISKEGQIRLLREKYVTVQLTGARVSRNWLDQQKDHARVIALTRRYPELDYLRDISITSISQYLTNLTSDQRYSAMIQFLSFIYGRCGFYEMIKSYDKNLCRLIYKNMDIVVVRLLGNLVKESVSKLPVKHSV